MRVLMLSWEYPPSATGGMSAHVDGLAHGLQRSGHEVVVITRRVPGTETDSVVAAVRVLRADVEMPWLPDDPIAATASGNHAFVAISSVLGDWRPDIVHAHDWGVAWAADVLATLHEAPIVTTLHGTERGRHGGHLAPGTPTDINAVEWWQAARSGRVITSTKLLVQDILDGFEIDPALVTRIPGGIDPAWWETAGPDEPETDRPQSDGLGVGTRALREGLPGTRQGGRIAALAGDRSGVHDRRARQLSP